MTKYDLDVIEREVGKALAVADLLTVVDGDNMSIDTIVGAGQVLTDILVGIKARLGEEE